jgi:hypothetical protein
MSTHSAKTAGRSVKTARPPAKKTKNAAKAAVKNGTRSAAKTLRNSDHAAAKSSRNPVRKTTRLAHVAPMMAPSAVPNAAPKMFRTPSPPVQPAASSDLAVNPHKYHVGETVYYTSPTSGRAAANGIYTVVKQLPFEGDDCQYRIKSTVEAFERVAKESQLDPE